MPGESDLNADGRARFQYRERATKIAGGEKSARGARRGGTPFDVDVTAVYYITGEAFVLSPRSAIARYLSCM